MSDGNRSQRSANWLAWTTASILILLAAGGGIYGVTQQVGYQQDAEDHAQKYASYAREKAEQPCRVLTSLKLSECLANAQREQENDARNKRREYDDLVAQQKSALWTNIMGLAAITGMILSVVGVWLVYATFRETKRTANEAARSADAYIAAERGWVKVSIEIGLSGKDTIHVRFSGILRGRAGVEIASIHCAPLEGRAYKVDADWLIVEPRIKTREPEKGGTWFALASSNMPATTRYFGGWVTYQTQFPGERRSYFLFEIVTEPKPGGGDLMVTAKRATGIGWPSDT